MGCNTSKEASASQNEQDAKGSDQGKNGDGTQQKEEDNHAGTDLTEKDTRSSSAKTITVHSNGTVRRSSETKSNNGTDLEEAATKIQAAFRGHKTRKSMKQPQAHSEPEKEPTREELENEFRLDDPELCNAATKIQASFRGHMSRKNMENDKKGPENDSKDKKEEELDIDLSDPDLNKAAAKIQASFRGHLTRKEVQGEGHATSK